MNRLSIVSAFLLATTTAFGASTAQADTLFTYSAGQPTGLVTNGTFNIGNAFQVGASPLSVTNIGAYVDGDQTAGLTNVRFLANIYNGADGSFISSTPIPIGTPVDAQGFAYVPFTTTLNAGAKYWVTDVAVDALGAAINTPFGYNLAGTPNSAGTWSGVTFLSNVYIANPSPATSSPNAINGGFQEFMGGNLKFTVPEPSSALFGLGTIGLAAVRRRRPR